MSDWKPKRFWSSVAVAPAGAGFGVELDGKPVRSPYRTPLIVPTRPLAEAIAQEWEAQSGLVRPESMPMTRMGNSALDKVAPQKAQVVAHLSDYAGTDLLCYRAFDPPALVERQAVGWNPVLQWAEDALGVRLAVTRGVMPVPQPEDAVDRIGLELARLDPFELTGVHDLIALSGSAILGLAVAFGHLPGKMAWTLSQIDEDWQVEQWGADDEASAKTALRVAAFLGAERFLRLSREQIA